MIPICGIAGFSVSQKKAAEIGLDRFLDISQAMSDTNAHRGGDAYGFMMGFSKPITKDNYKFFTFKDKGVGKELAANVESTYSKYEMDGVVPNLFGVHTRAKSQAFSEFDADNNHPVSYGEVYVTHNGMIRNHASLKTELRPLVEDIHGPMPTGKVDSLAIPMALSLIGDPEAEFEAVGEQLSKLVGGFAFAAAWSAHPTKMLLVAGPEYPLTVWFEDDYIFYASEEKCLSTCMPMTELEFKTKPVKFKPGAYLLLDMGEVKRKGWYDVEQDVLEAMLPKKPKKVTTNSNLHQRWNPHTREWVNIDRKKYGVTDRKSDKEETFWYSSVNHKLLEKDNQPILMFDKNKGMVNSQIVREDYMHSKSQANNNNKPPYWKDGDPLDALVEWKAPFDSFIGADRIYILNDPTVTTKYSQNFLAYAFFGTVEIVATDTGTIQSVIDWGNGGLEQPVYRTTWELKKEAEEPDDEYEAAVQAALAEYIPSKDETKVNWQQWIEGATLASVHTKLPGEKIVGTDGKKSLGVGNTRQKSGTPTLVSGLNPPVVTQLGLKMRDEYIPKLYQSNLTKLEEWQQPLTFNNTNDMVHALAFNENMRYTIPLWWDEKCPIHIEQTLRHHQKPLECIEMIAAGMCVTQFLATLEQWDLVFEDEMDYVYDNHSMLCAGNHDWVTTMAGIYEGFGGFYDVPEVDECIKCGMKKIVAEYPALVQRFMQFSEGRWIVDEKIPDNLVGF